MVFKVRQADGTVDSRINLNGRPPRADEKLTNIQVRNKELLSLLRKLKPLQSSAAKTVFEISQNPEAKDADRIKASAFIMGIYKDLITEVYDKTYDEQPAEEIQPTNKAPVFSLTMIKNGEEVGKS